MPGTKPYSEDIIAKLPEELRNLLDVNSGIPGSIEDKTGMPSVEEMEELEYTDPINECNKICSEVTKKHTDECKILRKRVAELLKRKGCPSVIKPYGKGTKSKCSYKTCGAYDGVIGRKKTTGGSSNVVEVIGEVIGEAA
jgi:hypothetical protein